MHKNEKLRELLKKPFVIAAIQNIVCLLSSLCLFHPHFEENDDVIIAFIAEGVYGARDSHLVYVNHCLGDFLKFLYSLCDGVRWHSVLQYVGVFTAFTVLSYILIREKKHGGLLSALFLLCTFYEAYVSLQYTKTAAILVAIGYVIIFYCLKIVRRGEKSIEGLMAVGAILLFYGALLRISCFYMATAVFILPAVNEVFKICRETAVGHKKKLLFAYLAVFAAIFMAICAFGYVDRQAYVSNEGWARYKTFNANRMKLLDYRYDLMNYETYGEELEELHVSENDALLYLTWQFGDSSVFNNQLINEVIKDAAPRPLDIGMLKRLAAHIFEELYGLNAYMIGILGVGLWMLLNRKKQTVLLVLYLGAVLTAVLCYYEYSGRWNHRVVFAILFTVLLMLLAYDGGEEKKLMQMLIGICLMINVGLFLKDSFDYNRYVREEAPGTAQLTACTEQHEDNLYLIDPFTDQTAYQYDVFKAYPEGAFKNRTYFGGWLSNSPVYAEVLKRYGYRNAFQALKASPSDERIYLIDNCYPEEKLLYLQEHYGKKLALEKVECVGGYTIYRAIKATGEN